MMDDLNNTCSRCGKLSHDGPCFTNPCDITQLRDAKMHRLIEATEAGCQWAMNLKPGDEFDGAQPESFKRYGTGTPEAKAFVNGALVMLDHADVYLQVGSLKISRIEWHGEGVR